MGARVRSRVANHQAAVTEAEGGVVLEAGAVRDRSAPLITTDFDEATAGAYQNACLDANIEQWQDLLGNLTMEASTSSSSSRPDPSRPLPACRRPGSNSN